MTAETPKPPLEDEKKSIREDMYETAKKNDVVYDPSKLKDATPDIKVGLADRWIAKAVKNDPEKAKNVYKALGIDIASVDDAATVARIEQFQKENNLEPDGIPGPKTLEKLDALTGDQGKFDKQLYAADGKPYSAEKEEAAANLNSQSGTVPTADSILGSAPQNNFTNSTLDNGSQTFASTPPSINLNEEESKTGEKTEEQKRPEGEKASPEELTKIQEVLTNDEDPGIIGGNYDYEVAREGNKLSRTEKTYGTVETWNSENQEWQSQTEEEKKETETAKQREQAKEQQTSIASINDKLDTIADKGRSTWFDKKLGDTLLTDVTDLKPKNSAYKDNDYRQDSQLSEEQIKALQGIDTTSLPRDMTIRQYTEYARDPLKAAQEFASRDKPEKLPGGLGEDGVQYQKNNTGTVFAYRADSEVPKIVTDKGEVDVQEYLKDKPQVNELFIGNGKSITTTPDPSGMRTYALVEKDNDDNIVSTREIKQDGTLFEQQSEAPTSVASR